MIKEKIIAWLKTSQGFILLSFTTSEKKHNFFEKNFGQFQQKRTLPSKMLI